MKNSILVCVMVVFAFFCVVSDSKSDVVFGIVPVDSPMLPKPSEPNIPFLPSPGIYDLRPYIAMGPSIVSEGEWGQHEFDVFHIKARTVSECFVSGTEASDRWCPGWTKSEVDSGLKKNGHPFKNYRMQLDSFSRWLAGRNRDDCQPYAHLVKSHDGRHYELGCYGEDFLRLTWETMSPTRVRTFNGIGAFDPGMIWAPTRVQPEKIYYTSGSKKQGGSMEVYRCDDKGGVDLEFSVRNVNVAMRFHGPYRVDTPDGRERAIRALRLWGLVPVGATADEVIPEAWYAELRGFTRRGGPVMLMVRHDYWGPGLRCQNNFCSARFEESYWYVSVAPDSNRPFGAGLVRWNVRERARLIRQVTAIRFKEELAKENLIVPFCGLKE